MSDALARYRLVIFDFDGTLADSFPWFLETINEAARRYGFKPLPLDRLDEYRGLGNRELIARLGLPMWKLPRVMAGMRAAMGEGIARIPLFDGALPLLRALRERGIACGLVSSNSQANIERVLGPEGVALIDHFACGASLFGKRKLLQRVATDAGVPAAQTLCVGDEQRDHEAAASLGMDFVGVGWGFATPEVLAACSGRPVLQRFDDLLALL